MKKIQILFFIILSEGAIAQAKKLPQSTKNNASSWFPSYDLNPANFKNPPQSFGPMARWWWPGNFVTKDELKREINLFCRQWFCRCRSAAPQLSSTGNG